MKSNRAWQASGVGLLLAIAVGVPAVLNASSSPADAAGGVGLARRCVGVFVTGERRTVAADSASLVVVGTVPCAERGVGAWGTQGVYRAFDDGSVEFLAVPIPPCPGGDSYVWIRYPNP